MIIKKGEVRKKLEEYGRGLYVFRLGDDYGLDKERGEVIKSHGLDKIIGGLFTRKLEDKAFQMFAVFRDHEARDFHNISVPYDSIEFGSFIRPPQPPVLQITKIYRAGTEISS